MKKFLVGRSNDRYLYRGIHLGVLGAQTRPLVIVGATSSTARARSGDNSTVSFKTAAFKPSASAAKSRYRKARR
jgi:hypothetical protein